MTELTKSSIEQNRGSCFIFEFSNGDWSQKGNRIFGPHRKSYFGKYNLQINSTGNMIMVGSFLTLNQKQGSVYIYYYSSYSDKWNLLHQENGY